MVDKSNRETSIQHVFIIGAKCIGQYGGYETFLDRLTEVHEKDNSIQYYILTKANGDGAMDETKLSAISMVNRDASGNVCSFKYHNANVIKLQVPQIGAAQAIAYDVKAFKWCLHYISSNNITDAVIYVLACRIGPFFGDLVKKAHKLGARVFVNPDGHEWKRAKWSWPIRKYWKFSEKKMVKHTDLLICDSINIEKYIQTEYSIYSPETTYIAYGADIIPSSLSDDDPKFTGWMKEHGLKKNEYYMCCGRFVPENSFEIMIREFMNSNTDKKLCIITTENGSFFNELESRLHFSEDSRIKFAGTVYDDELLKKIRECAYGYIHGHEVGGTNPSLLEALGCTRLNLLLNVGFNREVGEESCLYWSKKEGSLKELLEQADQLTEHQINTFGEKAKERIRTAYSWRAIADRYEEIFMKRDC